MANSDRKNDRKRRKKEAALEIQEEKIKWQGKDWWKYLISICLLVIYLFPFYIVVNVSLKSSQDTSSRIRLPESLYGGNFMKIFRSGEIFVGIKNTAIITGLTLVVLIVLGCLAAYALARNQSRINSVVSSAIMSVMMISPLTILVGVYSMMSRIHGISTYWGMVVLLTSFGLPLVIMLYTNFIHQIPIDLDEAGAIDGASNFQVFLRIIVPQLRTTTVTIIILEGVTVWNEYTYAYYFLQNSNMHTITLVVKSFFGSVSNDYGAAAATAVIGMAPLVILYLFLQRYFIQGQIDGAVKG